LTQNNTKPGLRQINELYVPGQPPPGQQQRTSTEGIGLALLGFGQDAAGELYVLGNINGTPFGSEGVVLRLTPVR
jgi:hypothetical protein